MAITSATFVALFSVSYVAGMTSTICDYKEHSACDLADVARTNQFDLAIRSNIPEWYRDGMQYFAWTRNGHKWRHEDRMHNRIITWAIVKKSTGNIKDKTGKIIQKSFDTWSEEIPVDFEPASSNQRADIRISFEPNLGSPSKIKYPSDGATMDTEGATISINDSIDWTTGTYYEKLPRALLREIGHALGLGDSDDFRAAMYHGSPTRGMDHDYPYYLHTDDRDGIVVMRNGTVRRAPPGVEYTQPFLVLINAPGSSSLKSHTFVETSTNGAFSATDYSIGKIDGGVLENVIRRCDFYGACLGVVRNGNEHERRFESEIRSSDPQWYCDGMRIFAYGKTPFYWRKRRITWALMNDPKVMTKRTVISAMEAACEKWAEVSSLTFEQVTSVEEPDIRLKAVPDSANPYHSIQTSYNDRNYMIDREGVTIKFSTLPKWSDRNRPVWRNFRYALLYHLGVSLGLGNSNVPGAVMYVSKNGSNPGYESPNEPRLAEDDIAAIKDKYGPPPPKTTPTYGEVQHGPSLPRTTTTYGGGRQPLPSSSSNSSTPSSSSTSSSSSPSSSSNSSSDD